jgi:alkylated DNA repair protein (DNA oxidative demethylase)
MVMTEQIIDIRGVRLWPDLLDRAAQERLVSVLRELASAAPFTSPVTRSGQKMSVRMTSAGQVGWISDRRGYRYAERHPSGVDWPPIPPEVLAIWDRVADCPRPPESCLVNWYGEGARMGMHQDRDEADLSCPVVSVSLGDDALLRIGGVDRGGSTRSVWLRSGDVVVMGGPARLVHHGVDRIRFGSSMLLPQGGRINLTLRVVT